MCSFGDKPYCVYSYLFYFIFLVISSIPSLMLPFFGEIKTVKSTKFSLNQGILHYLYH